MKIRFLLVFIIANAVNSLSGQQLPVVEKTLHRKIPDIEQPSLHFAPFIYYTPAIIFLTTKDTVSVVAYWRRNFTDQFLETWSDSRIYPASRVYGFIQDSVYYRSTVYDQYHIFAPQIVSGPINLYYSRYIHNRGEIRMTSTDPNNMDYRNNLIVTGDVPQRYANEFTYFVTFPWDTLKMIEVNRKNLQKFSDTYLRVYPEAYHEAMAYVPSKTGKILNYTLLPAAVIFTAAFLLSDTKPVYFIAIGAGAVVTYITFKFSLRPKELNPDAMAGIIQKCK